MPILLLNAFHYEALPRGLMRIVMTNQFNERICDSLGDSQMVFVAIKGEADWAVYTLPIKPSFLEWGDSLSSIANTVATTGDKITTEEIIRNIVPCDDDVFRMYRL